MATLKQDLKFLDLIIDKGTKSVLRVLNVNLHKVWVIDNTGEKPPFELPKNKINLLYTKVDPNTIEVLYTKESEGK